MNLNMVWLFWIRNLWAQWLSTCDSSEIWTMKFEDSCFQGCDGANRVNLWWICWWTSIRCWNWIVEAWESCDDWDQVGGDWCSATCSRETDTQACLYLPSDTIPNTATSITQTCQSSNGASCTSRTPSNIYTYSASASASQCYYKCDTWYTWDWFSCTLAVSCWNWVVQWTETCDDWDQVGGDWCNSSCKRETWSQACLYLPPNTIPNTAISITQTCQSSNGASCTSRTPNNIYSHNDTASTSQCYYKCDAPWYTRSWASSSCILAVSCWNWVVQWSEVCDDNNTDNNDWCAGNCLSRETPTCNFTITPLSWNIPLTVTFRWVEQSRAEYSISLWNWYAYNNLWNSFSWLSYTYSSVWLFNVLLTAKNSFHPSTQDTCSASNTTTWIIVTPACWDWLKQWIEECDDGNTSNNDWCTSLCKWEMPTCNFTMDKTWWMAPLDVTFQWTEQDWTVYRLNFWDWFGLNNQLSFSWAVHTYFSSWTFTPYLTVKNKYHLGTRTGCDAVWWANSLNIEESVPCEINAISWNIVTSGASSVQAYFTWKINPSITYKILFENPAIWLYQLDQFTKPWPLFNFDTTLSWLWTFKVTLIWVANWNIDQCATTVNVYEFWDYACWTAHKSDIWYLNDWSQSLCAPWYKAASFEWNSGTIINVIWWHADLTGVIIFPAESESIIPPRTVVDTGKNMVNYLGNLYIKHTSLISWEIHTLLLPEQWYKYWTRSCIPEDWWANISSCYAHNKLNWTCAYDMNLDADSWTISQTITPAQISWALLQRRSIFKCALVETLPFELPQFKYTRWLPAQGWHWNPACEVIPYWNTEQNLFYLHRICPWYNYWNASQSCDSVIRAGLHNCARLLQNYYPHESWVFQAH